jgi:hypothetical protein
LAERELSIVSGATESAVERLQVPTHVLALLLDQLAGLLDGVQIGSEHTDAEGVAPDYALRRLQASLDRERARRIGLERELQAERTSHVKTKQRLAIAEMPRGRRDVPAVDDTPGAPAAEGEPERRRRMAVAERFSAHASLRTSFDKLAVAQRTTLSLEAAVVAWEYASAGRALRTWTRHKLARVIRERASLSGPYTLAHLALTTWRQRVGMHTRGHDQRWTEHRGEEGSRGDGEA